MLYDLSDMMRKMELEESETLSKQAACGKKGNGSGWWPLHLAKERPTHSPGQSKTTSYSSQR